MPVRLTADIQPTGEDRAAKKPRQEAEYKGGQAKSKKGKGSTAKASGKVKGKVKGNSSEVEGKGNSSEVEGKVDGNSHEAEGKAEGKKFYSDQLEAGGEEDDFGPGYDPPANASGSGHASEAEVKSAANASKHGSGRGKSGPSAPLTNAEGTNSEDEANTSKPESGRRGQKRGHQDSQEAITRMFDTVSHTMEHMLKV